MMNWRVGLVSVFVVLAACAKKSSNSSSNDGASSTPDTFTAGAIAKTWTSNCLVGTEPITGANRYVASLILDASGVFGSSITWYSNTCSGVPFVASYTVYGNFTLGAYVSGSTTTKTMNFTINFVDYGGTDLMTVGNSTRSAYNTDCGMTSPFQSGAHATDGGHVDTSSMLCAHETFPNASLRKTFSNVVSYDGTALSLGAFDQANIMGAFPSGTVATTTTVPLH